MSYTLHTTTAAATGLIAQPGRAVNTFPSGLVRVDQTYIGRTALASTHRAILAVGNNMPDGDTSPCIDGLKIFPEAQERRREDGLTEYIVSAYGRSNTTGKKTFEQDLNSIENQFSYVLYHWDIDLQIETSETVNYVKQEICTTDRIIWLFCVPKNAQVNIEPTDSPKAFYYNGAQAQQLTLRDIIPTSWIGYYDMGSGSNQLPENVIKPLTTKFNIKSIEKTNFGAFDEWKITYDQPNPNRNFDKIFEIARSAQRATWDNLLGVNNTLSPAIGPVYNIDLNGVKNSPFVELTSSFQPTQTGRAKIQLQGNTYSIVNHFGYFEPDADNISTVFTPFSRPAGGMWMSYQQPMPPIIFQGVAEWRPTIGPVDTGNAGHGMRSYVYNLHNYPIYAKYVWTVTNEFNQVGEFYHIFEYNPEQMAAP